MSHKMAKAQRRAVRAIEKHPREVVLTSGAAIKENVNFMTGHYGVRRLAPSSGRAIYRTLKKAERKGLVQH